MEIFSREIIVYKLYAQQNKPNLGYLRAVAEKDGDSYVALNGENFCPSGKVFVTGEYEEIDGKYDEYQLFKVAIKESQFASEDTRPERNCTYITLGSKAFDLKAKEMLEIIPASLPDPNIMIIDVPNSPSTAYIYLNDEGTCYGPFKWEPENTSQIAISKIDSPMPGRPLANSSIYSGSFTDLKQHVLHCSLEEGERFYFESLTDLHNDTSMAATDYSSDEDVVNNFIKIAKDIGFNSKKIDLATLAASVKRYPKYNHRSFTEKLNKLADISDSHLLLRSNAMEGFSKFFRTELGDEVTKKYIESNQDAYLSDIKTEYKRQLDIEFRERTDELKALKDKTERNKQDLVNLGQEIEEINNIKVNANVFENIKESEDLDQKITQKKERLDVLNDQIKPLLEKYNEYNSLEELEKKLANVKTEFKLESRRMFEIEDEIKKLEALYKEDEDKLRTKLFELKPFVEAINGNMEFSQGGLSKDISQEIMPINITSSTAKDILQYIHYSLRKENRDLTILDVINITVTLQQSFICFLAGLPGGGKTTLARIVAKIYGIKDKRFLDIPVARGWTGQKDLIGFFNPISNKFQPSNTGLYQLLYALSEESKDEDISVPISMVLLDEANLSPIEHYWSSFMGVTDSDEEDKKITLGEDNIRIPENLRFIATINYDSTTEYLSPRLIDRSPIIVLEPNTIVTNLNQDFDDKPLLEMPISYEVMEKFFGRTDKTPEFFDDELKVYLRIKAILETVDRELGKPIIISSRKEIAIRQYCNRARPLMRESSTDDRLLALDYAVLQLVLPLLKGHGKNFGKRLNQLKAVLTEDELDRSLNYLETIINNGNADFHTYDFFCW